MSIEDTRLDGFIKALLGDEVGTLPETEDPFTDGVRAGGAVRAAILGAALGEAIDTFEAVLSEMAAGADAGAREFISQLKLAVDEAARVRRAGVGAGGAGEGVAKIRPAASAPRHRPETPTSPRDELTDYAKRIEQAVQLGDLDELRNVGNSLVAWMAATPLPRDERVWEIGSVSEVIGGSGEVWEVELHGDRPPGFGATMAEVGWRVDNVIEIPRPEDTPTDTARLAERQALDPALDDEPEDDSNGASASRPDPTQPEPG